MSQYLIYFIFFLAIGAIVTLITMLILKNKKKSSDSSKPTVDPDLSKPVWCSDYMKCNQDNKCCKHNVCEDSQLPENVHGKPVKLSNLPECQDAKIWCSPDTKCINYYGYCCPEEGECTSPTYYRQGYIATYDMERCSQPEPEPEPEPEPDEPIENHPVWCEKDTTCVLTGGEYDFCVGGLFPKLPKPKVNDTDIHIDNLPNCECGSACSQNSYYFCKDGKCVPDYEEEKWCPDNTYCQINTLTGKPHKCCKNYSCQDPTTKNSDNHVRMGSTSGMNNCLCDNCPEPTTTCESSTGMCVTNFVEGWKWNSQGTFQVSPQDNLKECVISANGKKWNYNTNTNKCTVFEPSSSICKMGTTSGNFANLSILEQSICDE